MKRGICIALCLVVWSTASPRIGAQNVRCGSANCIYLPSVMNRDLIKLETRGLIGQRDRVPRIAATVHNTSSQDLYAVTVLKTGYTFTGATTLLTETFDVLFAHESVDFGLPFGEIGGGSYHIDVASWTDSSDRVYRRIPVTIQKVEDFTLVRYVYGTIENQTAQTLRGLHVSINTFQETLLTADLPDTLAPGKKASFVLETEAAATTSVPIRAYGYLTQ